MPSRIIKAAAARLPSIPKELIDELVSEPISVETV